MLRYMIGEMRKMMHLREIEILLLTRGQEDVLDIMKLSQRIVNRVQRRLGMISLLSQNYHFQEASRGKQYAEVCLWVTLFIRRFQYSG